MLCITNNLLTKIDYIRQYFISDCKEIDSVKCTPHNTILININLVYRNINYIINYIIIIIYNLNIIIKL